MTDRDKVRRMLREWRNERRWARHDADNLAIESIERIEPVQVSLRTVFEARGNYYRFEPAPGRGVPEVAMPDPWSTSLVRAPNAHVVGNEIVAKAEGAAVRMDCSACSKTGNTECASCDGSGRADEAGACFSCRGRGWLSCRECGGSGGLLGYPRAWSRIDEHVALRAVGTSALPHEVQLDVANATTSGTLVRSQRGDRLHGLHAEGGYRDAPAAEGESVTLAARALCEQPGTPERARIVEQVLEVRHVPVYMLKLTGGASVYVWGAPPKVAPAAPLESMLGRVARAMARVRNP